MSQFIDRRPNSKNKSAVNRQRFIKRFREQIKKAVAAAANKRSITDIDRGEKIKISEKDIHEPHFRYGNGGIWDIVNTGNKDFIAGDHIKRSEGEGGEKGRQASDQGSGWDEFGFEISRAEFLDLFFDDLALPNLIKKQIVQLPTFKMIHAGFSTQGVPTNISIIRSLRVAHGRKIAFAAPYREKLRQKQEQLDKLLLDIPASDPKATELQTEIDVLKKKLQAIPFIDPLDLRYHNRIKQMLPTTQAVMFCLMDVSGSMDETKKDIAKRFFILLYLFLTRNYKKIDVVFIRHHTIAKEVSEEEFFYSRETGGTVVSSALELMRDICHARYPSDSWNIYAAQASDGDNWSADSPYCQELLLKHVMPIVQYFAYVEIMPRYHQSLWEAYVPVKEQFDDFAMQTINDLIDIYPVFKELFKRKES